MPCEFPKGLLGCWTIDFEKQLSFWSIQRAWRWREPPNLHRFLRRGCPSRYRLCLITWHAEEHHWPQEASQQLRPAKFYK